MTAPLHRMAKDVATEISRCFFPDMTDPLGQVHVREKYEMQRTRAALLMRAMVTGRPCVEVFDEFIAEKANVDMPMLTRQLAEGLDRDVNLSRHLYKTSPAWAC